MPDHVQELRLEILTHAPEHLVRYGAPAIPYRRMVEPPQPTHTEEAVEDLGPLRREKCRYMHPVRDVVDGVFLRGNLWPHLLQHARGDAAVYARYPVVETRPAHR